jgi:heme/copper-type cytochrome/quinol oxidase subunit 4
MSKNVGFPVMKTSLTGILFVIGIFLTAVGIVLTAALPGNIIIPIVWFIGLFVFLWSLLSFSLNPDLEDYQRNVAFLFLVLVTVILFSFLTPFGIRFLVTVG